MTMVCKGVSWCRLHFFAQTYPAYDETNFFIACILWLCSLGADLIYDPSYIPHLVRVLASLLSLDHPATISQLERSVYEYPVAYIATAIRNPDTLVFFVEEVKKAGLRMIEVSESMRPAPCLGNIAALNRATILIHKLQAWSDWHSKKVLYFYLLLLYYLWWAQAHQFAFQGLRSFKCNSFEISKSCLFTLVEVNFSSPYLRCTNVHLERASAH